MDKRGPKSKGWKELITRRRIAAAVVALVFFAFPVMSSPAQDRGSEAVMHNVQTHKVHKPTCTWAIRCTKNCIPLKRSKAYRRGGISCKVCGGSYSTT